MPCTVNCRMKILRYPQYWTSLEIIHGFYSFEIDGITITGTKSKIMVASSIISSIFQPDDTTNALVCSSLFDDACEEKSKLFLKLNFKFKERKQFFLLVRFLNRFSFLEPTYIELCLENINLKNIKSLAVHSTIINIGSVKIFAHNETDQAFILSGPELEDQRYFL